MKEENSIKLMLILFCGTYLLRVIFAIVFHINEQLVFNLFADYVSWFDLALLLLWCLWDSVPLLSMLIIHYKNFSSFKDEPMD